jgi:hypothetical protein
MFIELFSCSVGIPGLKLHIGWSCSYLFSILDLLWTSTVSLGLQHSSQ